jgi:hemolysin III
LFASVTLPVSILVVIGGIIYTTGVPFHLWTRLRFHNVIWHACVVTAAACHYAAIYLAFLS